MSNMSLIATMGLNTSRSGRKGGVSKRKRRTAETVTSVIDPFSGVVTSSESRQTLTQQLVPPSYGGLLPQPVPQPTPRFTCQAPPRFSHQHQPLSNPLALQSAPVNCTSQANAVHTSCATQINEPQQGIWQPYLTQHQMPLAHPVGISSMLSYPQQSLQNPVPPGVALPPKPAIPESNNPYFLAKIRGNISRCTGCTGLFKGIYPLPPPDDKFVIGRKEKIGFPSSKEMGKSTGN